MIGNAASILAPTARRLRGVFVLLLAASLFSPVVRAQNGIVTEAGQGAAGVLLFLPTGVAADDAGNFYIADTNECVIWKVSNGVSTVFAGKQGTCSPGTGPNPTLQYPIDVAWCRVQVGQTAPVPGGVLYFATHGFDGLLSGSSLSSSVGGSVYMASSSGVITQLPNPIGPAGQSPLFPVALACDTQGNLFVSSYFNGLDVTFGASVDEIPNGGTPQNWLTTFGTAYPGIAVHEFDQSTKDLSGNTILNHIENVFALVTGNGNVATGWLGVPSSPFNGFLVQLDQPGSIVSSSTINTNGPLFNPSRLAIDSAGNFFITQAVAVSSPTVDVTEVPAGGGIQIPFAGNGLAGYQGSGVNPLQAELNNATGMAFDGCGSLYIADAGNGAVRKVFNSANASFAPCTAASSGIIGTNIPATSISLTSSATQVAASQAISFTSNVSVTGCLTCITSLQGDVVFSCNPVAPTTNTCSAGGSNIGTILLNGPAATSSTANLTFSFPDPGLYTVTASYFDPTGVLPFVTSSPLTILVCGSVCPDPGILNVRQSANPIALTPGKLSTQYNRPGIVAFDAFGFTYILDSVAGTVTAFDGLGGSTQIATGLTNPSDMVLGTDGNLYITNTGANSIAKVTGPSTVSPAVSQITPALSLNSPTGIFETGSEVYVTDTGNNRVVAFRADGTFPSVIFSSATPGAPAIGSLQGIVVNPTTLQIYIANAAASGSSSGGNIIVTSIGGSASTLATPGVTPQSPFGLALDASNGLYFSDTGAHRIYRMDVSGNILVVAGNGTAIETGEGVSATQTGLANSTWLALDLSNNIWFTDTASIRQVDVTQALVDFTAVGQSQTIYLTSPVSAVQGSAGFQLPASPYVTGLGATDFSVNSGSATPASTCFNTFGPSPTLSPNSSCTLVVTLNTFSGAGTPTINFLSEIEQFLGSFSTNTALTQVITLNEAPAAGKTTLQISPATVPNGIIGTAYGPIQIQVTGGSGQLTLSQTGTLPPGLVFSPSGSLSGTPTQVGTFSFTISASDPNGDNGSQLFTLTINPVISISPGNPSVGTGLTQQFTATLVGTTSNSVTWSVQPGGAGGSISISGLYTAPATAGADIVVATSTAFPGATSSTTVTVTSSGPPPCPSGAALSISAPSASVPAGLQLQFTANVTGVTNPVVGWSVTPTTAGTISATGLFTAGTNPGAYVIVATLTSCSGVTASVSFTVAPPSPAAAVPAFSPPPGSYAGAQSVSLSSTAGATIYYTTDGTQPTTSSSVYSGPIPVSANETIAAIAGGSGFVPSATSVGRYSLYALAGQLIPGTLSSFIATTPVGSVPADVTFDASGNLYVLDSGLGTITKFAAGSNTSGTVIVTPGTLSNPQFFTVGADGQTLFVSDYGNNRIVTVAQTSSGVTVSPLTLTGVPSLSTPCAASPGATICQPTGITVDPNGNLYVADSGNQRLLKLTSTGTYVSTLFSISPLNGFLGGTLLGLAADNAGNVYFVVDTPFSLLGKCGVFVITPSASIVGFDSLHNAHSLTVDPSGDLYVSDSYTKLVYVFDAASRNPNILAGVNTLGAATPDSGDGGPATVGTFASPLGITLDSNYNLYIADANAQPSSGGSIREVNASQGLWNFASINYGQTATSPVYFLNPTGIPQTMNALTLGGTNAADFIGSVTTPLTLAPGQIIQDNLTFTPSLFGTESATLTPAAVFSGKPSTLSQSFTLNESNVIAVALPPTITLISCCNPFTGPPLPSGFPGESSYAITVYGTNFKDPTGLGAVPVFDFGPSISVSQVTVINSTTATMSLNILPSAAIGPVNVTVTTGSLTTFQGGTATLMGGFAIVPYLPAISSITANNPSLGQAVPDGYPGQTETVTITGTNFVDPTGNNALPVFNFGPGANATTVSVATSALNPSQQTANVNLIISPTAAPGHVNVSVTTGSASTFQGGTTTSVGGFTIAQYLPTIFSIIGSTVINALPAGYQGQTETVTITGTNLVDPTGNNALPGFNFGPGVTATTASITPTVLNTTQTATVNLTIAANALAGTTNVSVTSGSAATFQGGSSNVPNAFLILAANTPAAPTGQTIPVSPVDSATGTSPVTLTFSNVPQPGQTSLAISNVGPVVPVGFQLGTPPVYYNLSTTVTFSSVEICINYAGLSFVTLPPQLLHFTGGAWVSLPLVPTSAPSTVCGISPSLSPFVLVQATSTPTAVSIGAPGVTYGSPASVTVSVSSANGTVTGNVSLSVDGAAASTLSLTKGSAVFNLGVLPAGAHALSASFAAQASYLASSAAATISVAQAPLAIAANNAARVYGGANPALTATYSGFVNGDSPTVMIGALSCFATATQASPVGSYPIGCSGQSAANYLVSYSPGQLTVTSATLTITANKLTKNFDAANPPVTWTATGFANGDSTSVLTTLPTCATPAITTSPVGNYPITCSGAAAANYRFSYVPGMLSVICHYISIGVSPSTVAEGGSTNVNWTLRSCSNTTQTVAFSFTLSGPAQPDSCSPTKSEMLALPPIALKPNTLETLSFPFRVPKRICPGTYSVTASTSLNGLNVDSSTTSLAITAP